MEAKHKKVILMLEEMFNDQEFWYPYYRLKEAGAEVIVVGGTGKKEYTGKGGTKAIADVGAGDVDWRSFHGLVIPGGYAPDHMRRHKEMVELVKNIFEAGGVVGAICHAGWMLASAGILRGKKVTSFFAIKDDLINAGAQWVDQEVVVDENLVTSRKPDDLPAFMRAILSLLK